jgi:sugar lactone lactonase YvrE
MVDTTILAEGLHFGEGPRWHEGRLWFSDFYDHAVKSVGMDGELRIELRLDDQPSGLGWLADGTLLLVAMKARKLMALPPGGQLEEYADLREITAHLCNDMVVDSLGRAWVGNFGFDLDAELEARGMDVILDHPTTNLVRVDPDRSVHIASPDMHFPNGTVITPDGATLIVAETLGSCLTAFDIGAHGKLANRRVWAALDGVAPDGICLDEKRRVWVANALAPEVICVAEGGAIEERVTTSQFCYACMLGGEDGMTLFAITAASSDHRAAGAERTGKIESATVSVPHAGLP